MPYYPSLATGAGAQYPIVRRTKHDVLLTPTPGGYEQRGLTGRPAEVDWTLEYAEITDAEVRAFEAFYTATSGGLLSFTFCDPLENLLIWSEDLTNAAWNGAGVTVTSQLNASTGFHEASIANAAGGFSGVGQTLALPPGARCVLSCELQASGGATVRVASGATTRDFQASANWRRVWVAGLVGSGSHAVSIQIAPGATVNVRHAQAELQIAPSPYKPTYGRNGIYPETRFAGTALRARHSGPNRNSLTVGLTSRLVSES
jgi:hypothetical protein